MAKQKLKWFRDGADPYEAQYLAPTGWDPDDDGANDHVVAWIDTYYSATRFYHGRGGMGTSRPDGYQAYVGYRPGRALAVPGSRVGRLGPSFIFPTLTAAKQAIAEALAKTSQSAPVEPAFEPNEKLSAAWDVDDVEDTGMDTPSGICSACGGELESLGTLGNRAHYRCRRCGLDSSTNQ
jgi:hypothetical protein